MPKNVLICETDERDPYAKGLVADEEHPGPLLTLLEAEAYQELVLLHDEKGPANLPAILAELAGRFPRLPVNTVPFQGIERGEYRRLWRMLQTVVNEVRGRYERSRITVSLTSGQAETHVAWMQIVAENASIRLVQVDAPYSATANRPGVRVIRSSEDQWAHLGLREDSPELIEDIARDLDLIGEHPAFLKLLDQAAMLANYHAPILVTGEPGTGRTSLAYFTHSAGPRRAEAFLTADVEDLPDFVATSTLFGNREHSFGSTMGSGKLTLAQRGTLLIENVDRLYPRIQEALADYIDGGDYNTPGSIERRRGMAALVLTATCDSREASPRLAPRLAECLRETRVHIPALRERRSDVTSIALFYLQRLNNSLRKARTISRPALEALQHMNWPGNVRDLRLAIERAALLSGTTEISLDDIRSDALIQAAPDAGQLQLPDMDDGFSLENYLSEVRRRLIMRALELSKGNQSEAARMLRITPQAVHQFLKLQLRRGDD